MVEKIEKVNEIKCHNKVPLSCLINSNKKNSEPIIKTNVNMVSLESDVQLKEQTFISSDYSAFLIKNKNVECNVISSKDPNLVDIECKKKTK